MKHNSNEKTESSNASKRKNNGYKSNVLWAKRARKRQDAIERQEAYNDLTLQQKLNQITKRRGDSKKELARLTKNAAALVPPVVVSVPVMPEKVKAPKKVKKTKVAKS